MPHAMHEAGFEMARAQQLEQRALGIRVAHDHVGRQRFTTGEHDARNAIAIERDVLYRRGETNGCARGRGRLGEGVAHRAHAAGRQGHAAGGSAGEAREPMQQREHGVVGTRRQVGAEHGIEGQRGLQRRRFEGLFDDVEDVDARDAQELAHVVTAESADVAAQQRRADGIGTSAAQQSRRNAVVLLAEHARELEHASRDAWPARRDPLRSRDRLRACHRSTPGARPRAAARRS